MSMFEIRPCTAEDFDGVLALLRQLWPDKTFNRALTQEVCARALASNSQKYLCAADGARVVGFGSLTIRNNLGVDGFVAHIDALVVDSECRRKGMGTQLLGRLVDVAKESNCLRVKLDCAYHRKEAHKFYESHGFENRAAVFSKKL